MNPIRILIAAGILLAAFAFPAAAQDAAQKVKVEKIARYLANSAKKLTDDKQLVASGNWIENPEVGEVKKYGVAKRAAALYKLISLQQENEDKILAGAGKNQDQFAFALLTRLGSYSLYQELLGKEGFDAYIKDFLDGEIFDIKMVFAGKIPDGAYTQTRSTRKSKLDMLLMTEKPFVEELLRIDIDAKKNADNKTLANLGAKTFVMSLANTCMANVDTCLKLAGK
jgi:hypothetical protein